MSFGDAMRLEFLDSYYHAIHLIAKRFIQNSQKINKANMQIFKPNICNQMYLYKIISISWKWAFQISNPGQKSESGIPSLDCTYAFWVNAKGLIQNTVPVNWRVWFMVMRRVENEREIIYVVEIGMMDSAWFFWTASNTRQESQLEELSFEKNVSR